MIYSSENNWYYWQYGDGPINGRQAGSDKLKTFYSQSNKKPLTFKEELIAAARSTVDHYPGLKPCIFFSGGVDSEIMLRAYVDAGLEPSVFIVRYERDFNLYDVSYAITVCNLLNIPFKLVDFNLIKFYENDAEKISELAQIDRPRMLPHLKFTECSDGLIICGFSDITWYRPNDDYSQPVEWVARDWEHDLSTDKYNMMVNRPAIFQWFKWTPGLVKSYMNLNWFCSLTSDEYHGKLGVNSTKIYGYREAYPDLIHRVKKTGFEDSHLEAVIDSLQAHLEKKYKGLLFRQHVDRPLSQLKRELG